jgi:hypothetical protein
MLGMIHVPACYCQAPNFGMLHAVPDFCTFLLCFPRLPGTAWVLRWPWLR